MHNYEEPTYTLSAGGSTDHCCSKNIIRPHALLHGGKALLSGHCELLLRCRHPRRTPPHGDEWQPTAIMIYIIVSEIPRYAHYF